MNFILRRMLTGLFGASLIVVPLLGLYYLGEHFPKVTLCLVMGLSLGLGLYILGEEMEKYD